MKALIVYHAGAMLSARRIYRTLVQSRNIELTVIVPQQLKVDRVYDSSEWLCVQREENCDGYCLVPVPLRNPFNYGQGFETESLRRFIQQIKPDIIHVLDEPTSGYLSQVVLQRFRTSRHPKVLFYGFDNLPFRLHLPSRLVWKLVWSQIAGGVAANSETLKNLRAAGFPRSRPLERIFWGIPTDIFRPMDRNVLKKEMGLDCEHIVGFVGRLVSEKGLAWLLAAMKRLPSNIHCLIIGSGPMRGKLELWSELPSLAGRVHLLDAKPVAELPRYLNCMDVLAVPSLTTIDWKEQYGRVIAEAMACGVPVVGSDSGAIPEVIDSAGLIVPEGDVTALAEALQRAIFTEVRGQLIQQGLERAQQVLSVQTMSQRLLDFYNRVLDT